jgi:hypothetical protein
MKRNILILVVAAQLSSCAAIHQISLQSSAKKSATIEEFIERSFMVDRRESTNEDFHGYKLTSVSPITRELIDKPAKDIAFFCSSKGNIFNVSSADYSALSNASFNIKSPLMAALEASAYAGAMGATGGVRSNAAEYAYQEQYNKNYSSPEGLMFDGVSIAIKNNEVGTFVCASRDGTALWKASIKINKAWKSINPMDASSTPSASVDLKIYGKSL